MLLSHRIADFAANPVASSGGTVYVPVGFENSQTLPTGSQAGDISFFGCYCAYGRPQAIVPSAGWTQLSIRTYTNLAVALYAKVLSSTDISRGTTGFTFDSQLSVWNLTVSGTNPFSSFTTRGLATAGSNSVTKPELSMTSTTQNPGIILTHLMWSSTVDAGIDATYTLVGASNQVYNYQAGGRAQGQRHNITIELTTSEDTTNARSAQSLGSIGSSRDYTETILCLNGIE